MKEFDEAKKRINKISPSGVLQTNLVDAMNSLLELCGALMSSQKGTSIEINKPGQEIPKVTSGIPAPGTASTVGSSKGDPRINPTMKAEEKSKVSDLIDSISKVKK
jgi:hypothetical protein